MRDQIVVSILTFTIPSIGAITNFFVFLIARKLLSMHSSFGMITKNQAILNTAICLVFVLDVFPMQLTNASFLVKYSFIFGVFVSTLYYISNFSHFQIALNRFCAVFLNKYYQFLFSLRATKIMTLIITLISFSINLYIILNGCLFSYNHDYWNFAFPPNDLCISISWNVDFVFNTSLVVVTLIVNLLTAVKTGRNSRRLMNAAGIRMSKLQKKRELNFVKQAFLQGLSVFVGQLAFYILWPFFENQIILFVLGTMWVYMHSLEGADEVINYSYESLNMERLGAAKYGDISL